VRFSHVVAKGQALMLKRAVHTAETPSPVAAYSQAVRYGDLVQVSGQGPTDPATGRFVDGGIREQARQALANLRTILEASDSSFEDVLMMRIYLTDRADFEAMNEVYASFVGDPHPARTTVYVGLPAGMLIEVDALAAAAPDQAEEKTA
jgi:2-iminobutanoate/2-iminopropanoate deaminase